MRIALVLSEAASGLRRNFSMVVSIVLVTFVSLTFVGAAALLQLQIGQMKNYWYDKAQVAVYLCNGNVPSQHCAPGHDATKAQKDAIAATLHGSTLAPLINKVYFESRQKAFKNFKQQFKG